MRLLLMLFLLFWLCPCLSSPVRADDEADADVIPLVGRPTEWPFSDASGTFRVRPEAVPTALQAQDPLTFTVRIRAVGRVHHPPQRIDLRQVLSFERSFYVEDPEDGGTRHPDEKTWEFVYQLKPRAAGVAAVPSFPFVFYNPELPVPARRFQTLFTDPIPIQVRPRTALQTPLAAPEATFHLVTGDALLKRQIAWTLPSPFVLAILVLVPPLTCAAWYFVWRRLYPDAARA